MREFDGRMLLCVIMTFFCIHVNDIKFCVREIVRSGIISIMWEAVEK